MQEKNESLFQLKDDSVFLLNKVEIILQYKPILKYTGKQKY